MLLNLRTDPPAARLAETIEAIVPELRDWRPAWRKLIPFMLAGLRGNLGGRGHAPLTKLWLQRKAKSGKGRAMFVFRGKLLAELAGGLKAKLGKKAVSWGPSERYGYILHFGVPTVGSAISSKQRSRRTRRRSQRLAGKLPPRPWLAWTETMERQALELAKAHVDQALAGGGKARR